MNKMSWSIKQWKDVLSIVNGKNQKEIQSDNGAYPIIGSGGEIGRANDFLCEAGSTVVGRKGTINNPFFVGERFWNVDTAFGIQPGENLNPKFLFYFCKSYNFKKLDKSTTIPSLAKTDLLKIEMPVPSLDEQEKIVNRIEELFSELDSAVETLKKTKEQLVVYRQSVLKDAFEKYEFSKKVPVTDLVVNEKYALAIGPFGSNLKVSDYTADGVRLVFVKDIRSSFSSETIKFISEKKADELIPHCVYNGDLLITKMGDPPGDCCVYPYEDRGVITSDCIRIKVDESKMNKICLMLYILSAYGKKQVKTMTQGVAQKKISLERFKKFCVPVIGLNEQKMLVGKIQSRLSICDNIEKTVSDALDQAEVMRQSVLKKAFDGGL